MENEEVTPATKAEIDRVVESIMPAQWRAPKEPTEIPAEPTDKQAIIDLVIKKIM